MRQTKRLWTTSKDQAIRFLKTSIAKAFANGSIKENQDYGYLSIFQLRPSPELSTYAFDDANVEWLHCVAAHRKRLLFLDVEDTMAKYDIIAGTEGYTYFKMSDDVWTSLEKEAGGNYDEIWKVNQQFIDEQIAANKNILLSNDPYQGYYFDDGARRFYQREIDYILSKGYTFELTSDGLWKAVRK